MTNAMNRPRASVPVSDGGRASSIPPQRRAWSPEMRSIAWTLLVGAALAGCGRTVSSTDLDGFDRASAAVAKQVEVNLADANRIARTAAVDRFVRSYAVGITEDRFPPAVPSDVVASWRSALSGLERYGLLLSTLTDPEQGAQTSEAFKRLGVELNGGTIGAGISPGVASGFATLAGTLVELQGQRRAREILRRTDPQVRALLTAMADAVGRSDGEGLRGTVASSWTASTGELQRSYAAAAEKRDEPRQRALAGEYLVALDRRQAQLGSLAALRSSLLALADAHTAAADGSRRPVGELLSVVEGRLDDVSRTTGEIEREGGRR